MGYIHSWSACFGEEVSFWTAKSFPYKRYREIPTYCFNDVNNRNIKVGIMIPDYSEENTLDCKYNQIIQNEIEDLRDLM